MRIVARHSQTSTCPLCREQLRRVSGVTCSTCGAVAHRDCVREFGGCHGDIGRGDDLLTIVEETPPASQRPSAADRARARERGRVRARERGLEGSTPLTRAERVAHWVWGISVVAATIWVLFTSPSYTLVTGFFGFVGPGGLMEAWRGLTTGVVSTMAKGSSREYSVADQPCRFLLNLILWAVLGLALTGAALAPLFLPLPS